MQYLNLKTTKVVSTGLALGLACALSACGKDTASASGNVTIQSNPLVGPSAASLGSPKFNLASLTQGLADSLFGIGSAWASVNPFTSFKACNDTLIFLDSNGNQLTVNGAAAPAGGAGLLTFSNSSSAPMQIASVDVPSGTTIAEVDITFATKPSVCNGANYAVQFDPGSGPIDITQNTAFKFQFSGSGRAFDGTPATINLLFGTIVNAMIAQGTNLNNSTIQTINVGQAE